MNLLIKKELKLALHPTCIVFLLLSAMLLIPNYPYYVIFFYTSMAIFFTCLSGRENHDVFYTMLLPVNKSDVVKSRFCSVILLELAQLILCIPFAFLRQRIMSAPNLVGMDANIALFGLAFVMLGLFNVVFFHIYYRDVQKVGSAFVVSSILSFVYLLIAEALDHFVPFMVNRLDTPDPQFLTEKLITLAVGIVLYTILTGIAFVQAKKDFEKQDL